ncbi:MAG: alpha-ketoglutarate-dependent dioxygenase AlkB [Methylobacter sp.]|uniref:alpha-ketoglutarate-dependent dioxygenase AlkB family protein n=1 Tax=Methylobacter sp. TaxID=2051955 RepID=UPI002585D314|nr:alpha-ketoglutarate-dependent dioxygenase AlkB [Methylobacter sp.]MCL7420358.1 alpha-ketoglutarate-dependent dioxygenase AlkB [Methylobacter sp.]
MDAGAGALQDSIAGFGDNLLPFDGELYLIRQFYAPPESDRLFAMLMTELAWQAEDIFIFGKWVKVPRQMCWYGDADAHYRYSGVDHAPLPWTAELQAIREKVERQCRQRFNSVLANLYRDGRDSMGCHADNEKELGPDPVIASLSFGDERLFRLHHKKRKKVSLDIMLGHGDLLLMAGAMQHHWLHALPKTKQLKTPRINLTFRRVVA